MLSQALGGNSLTTIICTASPASLNYNQTLSTLRFATRAKTVKNKATVNEYQDEKFTLEEYKREIKKLREELTIKETEKEKEILQHVMKNNETIAFELENYKGLYQSEKDKNDQMRNEMESIKHSLATLQGNKQLTNSQFSNNTPFNQSLNSNFISSKENFFQNSYPMVLQSKNVYNDNNIVGLSDGNNSETNTNFANERSIRNGLKKYTNDINAINQNQDENFVEKILKKINQNSLIEGNKKGLWQEESQRISSDYK